MEPANTLGTHVNHRTRFRRRTPRSAIVALLATVCCGCTAPGPGKSSVAPSVSDAARYAHAKEHSSYIPEGYACIWHDEFDGENCNERGCEIDPANWQFQNLNVNNERMLYTTRQCTGNPERWNYCIRDGVFAIHARDEGRHKDCSELPCADDYAWKCEYGSGCANRKERYSSGRIMSKTRVEHRYGYIEFAFRVPFARQGKAQKGLWPALFMLNGNIAEGPGSCSADNADRSCEVSWPTAAEIDLLEYVSATPDLLFGNVHWDPGADGPGDGGHRSCDAQPNSQCSASLGWRKDATGIARDFDWRDWNTLGLKWEQDRIEWILNGEPVGWFDTTGEEEYDRDMFLILNMAVGGGLGGEIRVRDWSDARMEYAYLRWYQEGAADACNLN